MGIREKDKDEELEEIHFLKNPLPQPKKRGHVRMEFDIPEEAYDINDDFDITVSEDDDYDI